MENDKIDRIFRGKLDKTTGLPPEVNWNSEKGWMDYEEQYLPKRISGRRILVYISSVAAVFLLVFFSILVLQKNSFKIQLVSNNTDKITEFVLPDGNIIWLNKGSFC